MKSSQADIKPLQEGYVFAPYKIVIETTIITDKNGTTTIHHINNFKRWAYRVEDFIYKSIKENFK